MQAGCTRAQQWSYLQERNRKETVPKLYAGRTGPVTIPQVQRGKEGEKLPEAGKRDILVSLAALKEAVHLWDTASSR